jgi:hypothetical protein
MITDQTIEEVYQIRACLAAQFNYDVRDAIGILGNSAESRACQSQHPAEI